MRLSIKTYLLVLITASCVSITNAQNGYDILIQLKGEKVEKAYLSSIYGSKINFIDSVFTDNNNIHFKSENKISTGLYRLIFNDSLFCDIVFNNEKITLKSHTASLRDSMRVLQSGENKILYDYWHFLSKINARLYKLSNEYNTCLNKANPDKKKLKEIQRKIAKSYEEKKLFLDNVYTKKDLFAAVLIKAYQSPDFIAYSETKNADVFENEKDFLKDHFFDNIDFSDTNLLRSSVIFYACNDYLKNFVNPASTVNYIKATDFILSKASVNKEIYNYVLKLFIDNFESSIWEKVFINLVDKKLLKTSPEDSIANSYVNSIHIIKNLIPGKIAPNIIISDVYGDTMILHNIEAKVKIILFWEPDCDDCVEFIPKLTEIYEQYDSLGLEIFAIAVTADTAHWQITYEELGANWINVMESEGFTSSILEKYNIWSTPSLYMLNSKNEIICRPSTKAEIHARLIEELNK